MNERNVSLTINRTFAAPIEAVYAAWTDPEVIKKWLAPGTTEVVHAETELKVGGRFLCQMRERDGKMHVTRGVYREIVPNQKVVFTWQWEGTEDETLVTVQLRSKSPQETELTLTHERFADIETRDHHNDGWSKCFIKLEALYAA